MDTFIINHEGVLQTPSRFYGNTLERVSLSVPPYTPHVELQELADEHGQPLVLGHGHIADSPFVLMMVGRPVILRYSSTIL